MIAAVVCPAPRSLMPSSQITWVRPDKPSTSRSSRSTAAGPAVALATTGLTTRFPAIASFTTLILLPYALCSRRESTFAQRSLMFSVECVPSVMESPNAQTDDGVGWRHDVDAVEEEPGGRREFIGEHIVVARVVAASCRRDEGSFECAAMVGHGAAAALHRIAHRKIATLNGRIVGTVHPR